MALGVDSADKRNEYQEYFLGLKVAGSSGLPNYLDVPIVYKFWGSQGLD